MVHLYVPCLDFLCESFWMQPDIFALNIQCHITRCSFTCSYIVRAPAKDWSKLEHYLKVSNFDYNFRIVTFCVVVLTYGLDTWPLTLILTFDFNSWVVGLYSWLFTITFCVLHVIAMLWCIHFVLALTPKWANDRVHL